eukprot:XP_011616851.1 PREDICTED: uncharacterized protein LOC105418643 [Takifugu rubripes]
MEDEDEEPEPPPVPRRKVSFADAFGLNLVSVKEFDNADSTEAYENSPAGRELSQSLEEFSMSCLFTVPSSPEELDQKLREQTVELESIQLLPGTTTVRGNIRVVNLCYTKFVHVRMSLDRWVTHFDLLANYVPGSSDLTTDRFAFTYTLVPPLEAEGTRLELCLRYETPLGTFWANNKGMNYVLFFSKKAPVNGPQVQEEGKSKRSCLRASRRPSAEGKAAEPSKTPTGFVEVARKAEKDREAAEKAKLQFLSYQKSLVESVKSRRRETRLACVQDFMSQQRHHFPKVQSQEVDRPLPSMWSGPGGLLDKGQTSPRVLTYHEIPLLTLDWNSAKTCTWGSAQADDLCNGRANTSVEASAYSRGGTPCRDTRGNLPNVKGKSSDIKASVCDVWQAFLNGSSCGEHSGVLESEWLQTATSLSPLNNPKTASKHSCQLPGLVLNPQPEGACVSSPRDDRSETKFQTDTWQEFGLKGAKHVSKGPADRSDESQKIMHEQAGGGRIERMGEESCTPLTADLEPSSGGSESTEMPETLDSKTTRIIDKISRKNESLFSRLMVSRTDEICPIRADSLQQTQVIASTVKSEGSTNESAVTGAAVEMDDGPSQEQGSLTGEGLEIIQQSDERQQHGGEALQLHRGGRNMVPEATQKEEEDSQTGTEGQCPTSDGTTKDQQEVNPVTQERRTVVSQERQKVPQDDGETIGLLPNLNTADVEGRRWLLSQDNMESQEDISNNTIPKETYTLRQPETSGRMEDGVNLRATITELKIEEQEELRGNAGVPQGEDEDRLTQLEEGELSAEAVSTSSAEYKGTKDTVALNVTESELKKAVIEKFGEDLFWAIWEEVSKTSRKDLSVDGKVDDLDNLPTATQAVFQKGSNMAPKLELPNAAAIMWLVLFSLIRPVEANDAGNALALVAVIVVSMVGVCACLGWYARRRNGQL